MNCRKALELISRRVDGDLQPWEEHLLDFHLMGCASCRRALELTKDISGMVRSLDHPDVPEGFAEQVLERVRAAETTGDGGSAGSFWRTARRLALALPPVAAVLLLALGGIRDNRVGSPVPASGHVSLRFEDARSPSMAAREPKPGLNGKSREGTTFRSSPLLAYSREARLVSF